MYFLSDYQSKLKLKHKISSIWLFFTQEKWQIHIHECAILH